MYAAATEPRNQLNEWKAHASVTHVWSATVVSMIYLLYGKGYAAATEPRNQLNEWKAHASVTHVWSATMVSMIYLLYSKGMQQQLSPETSWMNGRPTHLLPMFDQPLWFLWHIGNFMPLCDHILLAYIVADQFDDVFTAWSMRKMRPEWSLPYTEYEQNNVYLILRISGMIFNLYWE